MTNDDEAQLRTIARMLFGKTKGGGVTNVPPDVSASAGPRRVREGDNPDPGAHFTYEDHLRQLALELFDPVRAATDPVTFDRQP
jgi:hypothetical protein